jgi:raffinose/stachyose/melibiose transport system substrate-binding protein
MKRFSLACLLLLATFAVAFGGGKQEGTAAQKVTLSWWTEWSSDAWHDAVVDTVAKFNQQHPNIQIVPRYIENEAFFTTMRTAFAGGQPPDIFQHESFNQLFQFVRPGQVLDITDLWTTVKDRMVAGSEISQQYKGRVWGIPINVIPWSQIFYNVDLLKQYGASPPATWDEFLADCEFAKQKGLAPIAIGNKYGWMGSTFLYALLVRWAGTDRVNQAVMRKPGVHWTDPDFVQSAKFFEDLNKKGYFAPGKVTDDIGTAAAQFIQGKSPFMHTGSFLVDMLQQMAPPDFHYDVFPFPQIKGQHGDPKEIAWMLEGLSISKATKYPEQAKAFLEYWTRLDTARPMSTTSPGTMLVIKGAMDPARVNPLTMKIYREMVEPATKKMALLDHTTPPEVGEENVILGSISVMTGDLTAEQWMANIEKAAAKYEPTVEF